MESSELLKIIRDRNIRQSPQWAEYLRFLKWGILKTSSGVNIFLKKTPIGGLVKIQRPPLLDAASLVEIEIICRRNNALFIKIEGSPGQDEGVFTKLGYFRSSLPLACSATSVLDLTAGEEGLWRGISRGGKYCINTYAKQNPNFSITAKSEEGALFKYHALLRKSAYKKKFIVQPFKDLLAKKRIFGDKFYYAEANNASGDFLCGKIFLGYGDTILYLSSTADKKRERGCEGYFLMWRCILHFKKLGYKLMDFEGVYDERFPSYTKGWEGFSFFKRRFGGTEIQFPYPYTKYLNPVFGFIARLFSMDI